MKPLINYPNFTKPRGLIYSQETIWNFKVIFSSQDKGHQAFPSIRPRPKQTNKNPMENHCH